MRDLDLKSLRLLVAVCDHQNIKQAAAQEHIEPSAISKRIAQLEEAVGAPLLLRGRRGVQPTPAGIALLEHARTMLFTAERIESDIEAFKGGVKGHVRMVASISAIAESLLDDVAAFMGEAANRDIKVDIEERVSRDLVRVVREGSNTGPTAATNWRSRFRSATRWPAASPSRLRRRWTTNMSACHRRRPCTQRSHERRHAADAR